MASLNSLLSAVLMVTSCIKAVSPMVTSAPFMYTNELPLYCFRPSKTVTAVLSSAAMRQLPNGLSLSFAKAPIKAIDRPCFFNGSNLFS